MELVATRRGDDVSTAGHGFAGPYRLMNLINTGQTSQVWQAYHDATRKYVAVKTLQSDFARDKEQIHYLKWELNVASKIDHERICKVYEFGRERGVPYLAMEWFGAPNLKIWIRRGHDAIRPIAQNVAIQATEAVAELSRHGWVHRDIKPENFLVNDEGQVKLIDFGLVQRAKKGWRRVFARKSKVQGTRSYMSPEQIRGKPLDERADLYSLACTLFELFAGRPPYTGLSANDLLMQHIRGSIPSLKARNSEVTLEFCEILHVAMAKNAERRQSTVEEFLKHLRAVKIYERRPERSTRPE